MKKKGGKFIAEGSFGCVVSPNYKCTREDKVSHNKISKIFGSKSSFEAEIKESDIFKTIDPTGKYFFKIYNHCSFDVDLNKEQSNREKDLSNCPIKNGKRYMYIGENAGTDLTNPDFKSKEEFDKILINILKGLVLLKKNNIVHRDIKPANLSVTSDGRGMILDYGLVTSISDEKLSAIKWEEYGTILIEGSPKYLPHENNFILRFVMFPDEETIRPFYFRPNAKFSEQVTNKFFKENFIKILIRLSQNDKFKTFFESSGIEKNKSGYGTYIYETLTKKYNKLIQDKSFDRIQYLKNYVLNYNKSDVYGLGISLLEILKKYYQKKQKLASWDKDFYDMIEKMIEPDIDKRWDAEQILNHSYFRKLHKNKLVTNAKQFSKKVANNLLNEYDVFIPKPIKAGKKVRKHQGINQIGGNKGRLKKGYRYSGKKLKSGLPQIIKVKL